LRRRLERAERQIATLVSTVEDIKKRTSQPRKVSKLRTAAVIVVMIAAGAALWGLYSASTYELPEPPPIESESSSATPPPALDVPAIGPAPVVDPPPRLRPATVVQTAAVPRVMNYVGTLSIDAEPGGTVFVNRKNVGHTPLRLDNLRAGSHLIWIERDGFRRWTRVVAVTADRVAHVTASLDPVSR
jgi:hypothetical protein